MKLARVAVLGIALGAGVIAAVLALGLTRRPSSELAANAPGVAATQVLVAAKDIPMGSTLIADEVQWQDWPKTGTSVSFLDKAAHPDAVTEVVGAIARSTFYAGEPITAGKIVKTDRGFMSAILPTGKRAVATKIAADTSAGGFILPNDRVDVIMTHQVPGANGEAPTFMTETILNNVRVLAIDQTVEDRGGEKVVVGQTATLELAPQQAQILSVAQQMSDRLTLALRSIADAKSTPGETDADAIHLIGGNKKNGAVTVVRNGIAKQVTGLR